MFTNHSKDNQQDYPAKKVTELRKNGKIEDAYLLAQKLYTESPNDRYIISAFGWVLITLLKQTNIENSKRAQYQKQLVSLEIEKSDELLFGHSQKVLAKNFDPQIQNKLKEAFSLSKNENNYQKACNIYKFLLQNKKLPKERLNSYGWDLYSSTKEILQESDESRISFNHVQQIKSYLNDYLKLNLETPSSLHSSILRIALNLASQENPKLDILAFLKIWDLNSFQPEDFSRNNFKGKNYPSLVEKTLKIAGKRALEQQNNNAIKQLLPFINKHIHRYSDNKWLIYRQAQLLLCIGDTQEAFTYCLNFIKKDSTQFWAWDLLGDCCEDETLKLSCYAKALLCSSPEEFTVKVRTKFAEYISKESPKIASCEINGIISLKTKNDQKIPKEIFLLTQSSWYDETLSNPSPQQIYKKLSKDALELLYHDQPCFPGCIGEIFSYENKAGKKVTKRKIYVQFEKYSYPQEINHPLKDPALSKLLEGEPINVQTSEADPINATNFRIKKRDGEKFDIFQRDGEKFDIFHTAIITGRNQDKNSIYFVTHNGTTPIEGNYQLKEKEEIPKIGDFIKVNLSTRKRKDGSLVYQAVTITSTKECPTLIYREFKDIISNISVTGNAFTEGGIFIPNLLATNNSLTEYDTVHGICVKNYNKKKKEWGWKALSIKKRSTVNEWEMNTDISALIGYIVKGRIVTLSEDKAVLDIGLKKEGYLTLQKSEHSKLVIGDYIEVIIEKFHNEDGHAILSQPK